MAADLEIWHWFLTPKGWVKGGCTNFHKGDKKQPDDAVLEYQFITRQSSIFSLPDESTKVVRLGDPETVRELKSKFGNTPPQNKP